MSMNQQILIIGAGVSGLVAAIELEKRGFSPKIIESTDHVGGRVATTRRDGWIMEHGFQVLLTEYPEARHYLDYRKLDLQYFDPGALVHSKGAFSKISDPVRSPGTFFKMLFSTVGTIGDKLKIFTLQQRLKKQTPESIFAEEDTSTLEYLKAQGFSDRIIENFFRPFFGGIFLENDLDTSSRMFKFVFKMFAQGHAAIPAKGMAEIPKQLEESLSNTTIEFETEVRAVNNASVETSKGTMDYDRIILTIPPSDVFKNMESSGMHSVTNLYFKCNNKQSHEKLIMLSNSGDGWINNMHFVDSVLPMPDAHGHLLSVTVTKNHDREAIRELVHLELSQKYGMDTEFVEMYHIPRALPRVDPMAYSVEPKNAKVNTNVYMAGDQLLYPSLNAAMHAGRLAAVAVADSFN